MARFCEEMHQATRVVMEEIMLEELPHFEEVEWGESSLTRIGYRNR